MSLLQDKRRGFYSDMGKFYGGKTRGGKLEVDRKDNKKGYNIDNCFSCCSICNKMKSNIEIEVFISKCKKISIMQI